MAESLLDRASPIVLVVIAAVVVFGALSWLTSDHGGSSSGMDLDSSAQLACQSFASMASNIDLMTFDEQRQAAQDVWDKAQVSDNVAVRDASRDMLDAMTPTLDEAQLRSAVQSMATACT